MHLERLLQVTMATLATLATLLVGMGLREPWMPLAMLAAAMLAVWLTDFTGLFAVSPSVANALRLMVLAWCLLTLHLDRHALVMQVAQLLIVLQAIVLFQRKDPRTYWHLAELSLLQVVVAALLTQGLLFGVLLVVFLVIGLAAMALLFLYQEQERCRTENDASHRREPDASPRREPDASHRREPDASHRREPVVPDLSRRLEPAIGGRLPWLAQPAEFSAAPLRLGVDREFFARLLRMAGVSLVLSAIAFFLVPRLRHESWRGAGMGARATVGFNDRMRLGELGRINQDRQEVLRMELIRGYSEERYLVRGEVYLRGAIVNTYRNGAWEYRPATVALSDVPTRPWAVGLEMGDEVVRQRIQVEPLDRSELFCVWPFAIPKDQMNRVTLDAVSQRLLRAEAPPRTRFEFELLTTAFVHNEQTAVVPNYEGLSTQVEALLQMPRLPKLDALAWQWFVDTNASYDDRYVIATSLERKLRDSGEFQYSLRGQARDPALDPIEDFLTQNRVGHCEYYATALALMLRSLGVPCRVVIGFRADEWNDLGQFYTVRQSHAHAWVEAYLKPGQVPSQVKQGANDPRWDRGAWLRLDPTPAGDPEDSAFRRVSSSKWFDWLDYLWNNYVLDMDRPRQQETIYRPVAGMVRSALDQVLEGQWWSELAAAAQARLGVWWQLLALILGVVLLALVGLMVYLVSRLVRLGSGGVFRLFARSAAAGDGAAAVVQFYRRFEVALAARGLVRPPHQTQREFALAIGPELALRTGDPRLADGAAEIAAAFYQVRFGGQPLDKTQAQAVEQALAQLEHGRDGP